MKLKKIDVDSNEYLSTIESYCVEQFNEKITFSGFEDWLLKKK